MEYLGYVAANNPPPAHYLRRPPPPQRSNSTKVTPTARRSLFPGGHRRTNSSDSTRNPPARDIVSAPLPPSLPPLQGQPHPAGDVAQHHQHRQHQQLSPLRGPVSVTHRNKQLPPPPLLREPDLGPNLSLSPSPPPISPGLSAIFYAAVALPSSLPSSVSAPVPSSPSFGPKGKTASAAAGERQQQQSNHAAAFSGPATHASPAISTPGGHQITRTESLSSTSGLTALSTKTMLSSEPPSSAGGGGSSQSLLLSATSSQSKPFVIRNGRTYLADSSLPYPLPVDLAELHRQSLRSLLLFQLFGGPICSPAFANKPPTRVLEVGCGSAFWSIMCNQYYTRQGYRGVSFTGIDVAPMGLGSSSAGDRGRSSYPSSEKENAHSGSGSNSNMNWRFVQHDIRRMPWPFPAGEFDLIMVKDISLALRTEAYQMLFDECIRLLQPGGTLEVWDSDHTIRMLRPHVPEPSAVSTDEEDEYDAASSAGAYVLTPNTPLSAPLNTYIVEYNAWLVKALEARSLPFAPCALTGALFLQEADSLTNVSSRRLAVPLSEMRWEREGVGGVVTKDGKTYIETKGKTKTKGMTRDAEQSKKTITPAQSALRRTALLTVVQMVQSIEPILREVNGKSQDEWDGWAGKMMNDLMKEKGTFWGECLEIGAWWAQKR